MKNRRHEITHKYLLTDTHIDVPYRLHNGWVDVTVAAPDGQFDYPRAVEGGLDLPFMSIYTPAEMEKEGGSFELANQLIDAVEAMAARAPDKFMLVYSVADAKRPGKVVESAWPWVWRMVRPSIIKLKTSSFLQTVASVTSRSHTV